MPDPVRKIVATGGMLILCAIDTLFVILSIHGPENVDAVWRATAAIVMTAVLGVLMGLLVLWGWPDRMDERNRWTVEEDRR